MSLSGFNPVVSRGTRIYCMPHLLFSGWLWLRWVLGPLHFISCALLPDHNAPVVLQLFHTFSAFASLCVLFPLSRTSSLSTPPPSQWFVLAIVSSTIFFRVCELHPQRGLKMASSVHVLLLVFWKLSLWLQILKSENVCYIKILAPASFFANSTIETTVSSALGKPKSC